MFLTDDQAAQVLRSRTSKLIGGYVTEHLFLKTFLEPSGTLWTKDWWAAVENSYSKKLHFFVVKNALEEADRLFMARITEAGYECEQIIYNDDKNQWEIVTEDRHRTIEEFAADHSLKCTGQKRVRDNNEEDTELEKCISYYSEHGMLHHIAESILLEDAFLNRYFYTINLDYILIDLKNNPVVFEIKFKNEFKNKDRNGVNRFVFGMDKWNYDEIFKKLIEAGVNVFNVILYNDVKTEKNKNITVIFEYLEKNPAADRLWKIKRLPSSMDGYKVFYTETLNQSFMGNSGRWHYCIPLNEYKPFPVPKMKKPNYWRKCPVCGAGMEIVEHKKDRYEYMCCSKDKKHR